MTIEREFQQQKCDQRVYHCPEHDTSTTAAAAAAPLIKRLALAKENNKHT